MKLDAKTFRLLTGPVREAVTDWMKGNGLPDSMNVLELDIGDEETVVTVVLREPDGNIADEFDAKGQFVGPKKKTFTYRTASLPGRVRRALA